MSSRQAGSHHPLVYNVDKVWCDKVYIVGGAKFITISHTGTQNDMMMMMMMDDVHLSVLLRGSTTTVLLNIENRSR